MLDDALELLLIKTEEIKNAAHALQAQKTEQLAGELLFAMDVLGELIADDPVNVRGIGPIRRLAVPEDPDVYPDGVSDDDPEVETPELRKRREEFKDRGYYA